MPIRAAPISIAFLLLACVARPVGLLRVTREGGDVEMVVTRPMYNYGSSSTHSEINLIAEMERLASADPRINSIELVTLVTEREECPVCSSSLMPERRASTGARLVTRNRRKHYISADGSQNRAAELRRAYCL